MKILLIEPTKLYQQIIYEMLANTGIDVDIASSGYEGFNFTQKNGYDFILVSKNLPDMKGVEFSEQVHKLNNYFHNNTLVMLTADGVDSSIQEAQLAGYTEVLPKDNFEKLFTGLLRLASQINQNTTNKILYIEDTRSVAAITTELMEQSGLLVDHFTNGEQAMQSFISHDYDMVVTDVFLEGKLTGADIVERIRKSDSKKSRIPILAVSAQGDTKMRIDVLRKGANDFINKPIQKDEFCARITNLLALKKLFDQVDEQQKKLFDMAMTDQLTQLYNRHSLTEMAPKYISDAKRHRFEISLLVIDLDHFKNINDTHGHATGDIVLSQVGRLLRDSCRKEDFAARFGGEEFVMLLSHCDTHDALQKAENLRQQIEALKPADITITASIGVSSSGIDPDMNFDKLFEEADRAVYQAKDGGRNQVQNSKRDIAA